MKHRIETIEESMGPQATHADTSEDIVGTAVYNYIYIRKFRLIVD